MQSNDDELLRSYFLGALPEEEADRLERRLLAEDDLFELSEAVEGDLLAEYAQGGLTPTERERVQRLAASPRGRDRLALARSLNAVARGAETPAAVLPFAPRKPLPLARWAALAAGLLAVAGLSWLALEQPRAARETRRHPAPVVAAAPQAAPQPKTPAPPEPTKAVFQLALATLRGAESTPKLRVPAGTGTVELQIAVEGMEDLGSFHLTVRDRKGEAVWEQGGLEPRQLDGVRALVVDLPAGRLPAGRYEIQAQGRAPGSEPEDLSPLEFEVVREGKG